MNTVSAALGAPETLLIEVTSRCNLSCTMCPLTSGETPSSHDPGNIDDAVWKATLPLATAAGRVNLGGYGEPLSNQRCLDYLRELDALGVRTVLTTNATMVNRKIADQLAALAHFDGVNVSIDSPDPEIYQRIRGGKLAKALEGLGHLRAALKPDQITVSSVMMTSTVDSLAEFPAILAGLNIKNYVLQGLVDYATGLDAETIEWQRALPAYADRIKAAGADAGVHVSFALPDRMAAEMGHAPPPPEEKPQHRAKQCHLPWLAPVVDKDGRMFPCCFAMSHADGTVGNVKESNALDLWASPSFQSFRRAIVDGRTTPSVCARCTVAPVGPHLFGQYAADVLEAESELGDVTHMRLRVRNRGTEPWTREFPLYIGTADPRDHPSAFHHSSWIGANRVAGLVEDIVLPGAVGTFRFQLTWVPEPASETFQLLVEHKTWLPETLFQLKPVAPPTGLAAVRRGLRRAFAAR